MKQSDFLSLGWRDFLRGLIMAILTPIGTLITNSLNHGEFTLNWNLIWISAVGGAIAYFIKNVFTKPDSDKAPTAVLDAPIDGGGDPNDPKKKP